jgi:hypothetical protein
MTLPGEMKESLGAGLMVVNAYKLKIYYEVKGPDDRYNSDYFVISDEHIEAYISGMVENIEALKKVRQSFGDSANYEAEAKMNMRIILTKEFQGVYIPTGRFGIYCDLEEAENLVSLWRYASVRALEMQAVLKEVTKVLPPAHPPRLHPSRSVRLSQKRSDEEKKAKWENIGCAYVALLGVAMIWAPFKYLFNLASDDTFMELFAAAGLSGWVYVIAKYLSDRNKTKS